MMLNFPRLSKLKVKQVIFQEVILAADCGTLEQLKELSSRRRAIEDAINESSSVTKAIAREMSGGLTSQVEQDIQKLEWYLPLLENFVHHGDLVACNPRMVRWISDLKIRWSSALTSSSIFQRIGPKFFQIDDLRFELGMALFLYGAMLRDLAVEILSKDLVQSTSLFRRAGGIYHYLAHKVLPSLQPALIHQEGPPEARVSVSSVMSLVCLAEAQAVTARRAEEKGNTGKLLAKLHCGISEFLDEAIKLLNSAAKECKDISSSFLDFISSCKTLHMFRSYKYLAESLKADGQIGVAIGVLRHILTAKQKHIPREELWQSVFKQVSDDITALLRKYEHENEFVWHEKVPVYHELPSPESVKIVTPIPYQPQRWERTLIFKV